MNRLGADLQGDATYQIYIKTLGLVVSDVTIYKIFLSFILNLSPYDVDVQWTGTIYGVGRSHSWADPEGGGGMGPGPL